MDIKVFDLHTDILTFGFCEEVLLDLLNKERENGNSLYLAVYTSDANNNLDYYNRFCFYTNRLCIENCAKIKENEIISLAPFYASLTWNFDNEYAGGALTNGSITDKGISLIRQFNANRIILDLAHIGKNSFYKAIEISDRVMVSHACCNNVHSHFRNFTDDQIRLVVEKNGLFGLCFVSDFLTNKTKATIDDVVKHIDYFCNKFSYNNLAIGTDFFGTKNGVKGVENYSDFIKIYEQLKKMGYDSIVIEDIFFNNANKYQF